MPAARRKASSRTKRRNASKLVRRQNEISSKIDELNVSIERIKQMRAQSVSQTHEGKGISDSLSGLDIHSMVEKAANLTSRWERTISLMGLIGTNLRSMSSPLVGPLFKMGLGGLGNMASHTWPTSTASNASGSGYQEETKGDQLDYNDLMQTAQMLLGKLSNRQDQTSDDD